MANNDNDGGEPVRAGHDAVRSSALIGLDPVATETVTLLLEILGWSVTMASSLESVPKGPYRLVFVDDLLFASNPKGYKSRFSEWLNVVLIGPPSPSTFICTTDARIFRADLPLDVAILEAILTTAA